MIKVSWQINSIILLIAFILTGCSVLQDGAVNTNVDQLSREDKLRRDVVAFAEEQEGSSYRYAGRDPRGFDCSGFTHYVMKKFDISLTTSSKSQATEGAKISVKEAKPGDLIFFKRSAAGRVFHVALVVSNTRSGLRVIHSTSRGVVLDNLTTSKYWKPKISSARDVISESL